MTSGKNFMQLSDLAGDDDPARWAAAFIQQAVRHPQAMLDETLLCWWFAAAMTAGRKKQAEDLGHELKHVKRSIRWLQFMIVSYMLLLAAILVMLTLQMAGAVQSPAGGILL